MKIIRYTSAERSQWDAFVRKSRNGTFLFERAYMDYHNDRFRDHSLMYFNDKNKLVAILPACEQEDSFVSHAGLTYGGFVLSQSTKADIVLDLFDSTKAYLKKEGFVTFIYKPVPYIYHLQPSQEDLYSLWRNDASMIECNLATSIDLRSAEINAESCKERGANFAQREGITIEEIDDLSDFWPIVENNLEDKYSTKPVHSLVEIQKLKNSFPKQIRCFIGKRDEEVIGGILVFESKLVVHNQYPHATEEGKKSHVMDFLFLKLIEYYRNNRPDIRYFDFGTSNERHGEYLNPSLIAFKESFGGRGVAYSKYEIRL